MFSKYKSSKKPKNIFYDDDDEWDDSDVDSDLIDIDSNSSPFENRITKRFSKMSLSLNDQANNLMNNNTDGIDKSFQMVSFIHRDLNFRRNSINLMIGKRGSGKTYNVIREVIKVGLLPDHAGYTSFVIVSDKDNDSTINEQKNRIKLKLIHTNYNNATKVLNEIKEAKTAYDQVIRHNLQNKLTEDSREEILSKVNDKDFYNEIPCSIILLDDAMNTLKLSKYEKLVEEIFRSRQPRFTIFLCAQDYFGIPCSIRRNLDSFWLFGGFADKKYFNRVFSEVFSTDVDEKIRYWEEYKDFSQYEALYIDFHKSPLKVEMIHK